MGKKKDVRVYKRLYCVQPPAGLINQLPNLTVCCLPKACPLKQYILFLMVN